MLLELTASPVASITGFNVETVEYKNISFTVWDVGGQDKVNSFSNLPTRVPPLRECSWPAGGCLLEVARSHLGSLCGLGALCTRFRGFRRPKGLSGGAALAASSGGEG